MKYVHTYAITPGGWGMVGVFKADVVADAPVDDEGHSIIDSSELIVGNGPGWDDNAILDEEWLIRACEALSDKEGD